MVKTDLIETLAAVQEMGSFSAVARARNVSPMAISKQISLLEKQVGEALINRSKRTSSLTEMGIQLLDKSQNLLSESQALSDWLVERAGEPAGVLKVALLEEPVLRKTITPWVAEFLNKYPKVQLEVKTETEIASLSKLSADVYWGIGPLLGELVPGLKRKPLIKTRFGIYASKGYLHQYGVPREPKDLSEHFVIGSSLNHPNNTLVVQGGAGFNENGLEGDYLKTKVVCDNNGIRFAEQGLGLINIAEAMFNSKAHEHPINLEPVLEDYWIEGVNAYVYYHQTKIEQPKVRAFIDFFYEKRNLWLGY